MGALALKGDFKGMMSGEKQYTIEDIFALPEGQRAELFDGEMIMMASPTTTHQSIIGWLHVEITNNIRARKGSCRVMLSPFGVFLKDDGKNYVEPDLTVICDREMLNDQGCHGGPDWVIEVVSPSSRRLDYGRKLAAYIEAGVREYWVVDAEKKVIVVYYLDQPDTPVVCRFGEKIAAQIYEDFVIDTAPLEELLIF